MKKQEIKLKAKERQKLLAMVSKGRNQAVVIRRAHILLKSDEGKTDREICEQVYVAEETVRRTRLRFCEEGLEVALTDKAGRGAVAKVAERQEAHLTALACTQPPDGNTVSLRPKDDLMGTLKLPGLINHEVISCIEYNDWT